MPAHRIGLAVGPYPLAVLVRLVAGDADHRVDAAEQPRCLHHVDRAHDVGRIGFDRLFVRQANQRLCREMEHDFRACRRHRRLNRVKVAHIANDVRDALGDASRLEQAGLGWGGQCVARHFRAELGEPEREPASLEAGMPGQKDAFALPVHGRVHARIHD